MIPTQYLGYHSRGEKTQKKDDVSKILRGSETRGRRLGKSPLPHKKEIWTLIIEFSPQMSFFSSKILFNMCPHSKIATTTPENSFKTLSKQELATSIKKSQILNFGECNILQGQIVTSKLGRKIDFSVQLSQFDVPGQLGQLIAFSTLQQSGAQ